jgi:photosystem II stability/assembly factor-like uncharacterized protein
MNTACRRSRKSAVVLLAATCLLFGPGASAEAQDASAAASLFEKFNWRAIGPALMGGRTVDFAVVETATATIYAAMGPSGVWKSENNGLTWAPVFFAEGTVSAGAVAVASADPSEVWVGSGESTCRNSVTVGDGVYKSTDAGKTWTNMGLKETRHISRVIIDRADTDIVFVAAMGHLWGPNPERGVFKSTDGGKTWAKVLYVDENTGIADLAQDPFDGRVLYAAAYDHRRQPWRYISAGPGSGLYKSADGGATWTKLSKGLPEGLTGRIGIGLSRSKPGVVYALIEHADPGLFRSEDGGGTWQRVCNAAMFRRVNSRPFYYSRIFVDPSDDGTVYVLSTGLWVSNDQGRKFRMIGGGIHSDHHGFWIDPANPLHFIDGNDGGIDITWDGGRNWQSVQSIDAAEVYQVGYDMRTPYFVYVGLQDNNSWGGPSATLDPRGVLNEDWFLVSGGDGFFVKPDPSDADTIYANSQMNGLVRFDGRVDRSKGIRPAAPARERPYRFNWNSPVLVSPHDPKTVYTGGNVLFKTEDGGGSWTVISPDLTTDDKAKQVDGVGPLSPENSGAEMYCTITTISESPLEKGVLWCGTDDGNLQVTRDSGRTWKNTSPAIPGLPGKTWCSRVEASRARAGTAYAAFDGHRTDDDSPYVYKTTDYGRTWAPIGQSLPFGWVHVIREDPRNENLLYAGTEFGIFASLDGGRSWFSLRNNLPTVAVHDIAVHPRENDLIIGTHGRGVWILDDISSLQEMTPEILAGDLHLFSTRPFTEFLMGQGRGESFTRPPFAGRNPDYGVVIAAWLKTDLSERPRFALIGQNGDVRHEWVSSLQKAGLQREVWNLQFVPAAADGKTYPQPATTGFAGLPLVPPGLYTLEMRAGDQVLRQSLEIKADPRIKLAKEDLEQRDRALGEGLKIQHKTALAVTSAKSLRRHLDKVKAEIAKANPKPVSAERDLADFEKRLAVIENEIVPEDFFASQTSRDAALRGGSRSIRLLTLISSIAALPERPSALEMGQLAEFSELADDSIRALNILVLKALPKLNQVLIKRSLTPFPKIDPIVM